jgi:hypothetical protein
MSDMKTAPAMLDAMLRPRRMRRIHGTIARTRADGAWFDAVLWSVFAFVAVGATIVILQLTDLWWRWFKWHVNAEMLTERGDDRPHVDTGASS